MKYQPEDITIGDTVDALERNFKEQFSKVVFKPLGEGSWLYDVFSTQGKHYILKINNGLSEETVASTCSLSYIEPELGLAYVKGKNGNFVFDVKHMKAVLSEYISGEIVADSGRTSNEWSSIGALLAKLHTISLPNTCRIYEEEFQQHRKSVGEIIKYSPLPFFPNSIGEKLVKFLKDKKSYIDYILEQTDFLGQKINSRDFVVTHGDAHTWNIVKTGSNFRLIDWDEIGYALPERDLMHYCEKPNWNDILRGYQSISPEFQINDNALQYYKYEWVLQEISDYGSRIFFENISEKDKEESFQDLESYF